MKKIYIDTETTALVPGNVIQLSYIIKDEAGGLTGKNYYFMTDEISQGATDAHGITLDKLAELSCGKRFGDYGEEIRTDLQDHQWIAHNFNFDNAFISTEFSRLGMRVTPAASICTVRYFTPITRLKPYPGRTGYKFPSLIELMTFMKVDVTTVAVKAKEIFGIDSITMHDSRFDTTALLLCCMKYQNEVLLQNGAERGAKCQQQNPMMAH